MQLDCTGRRQSTCMGMGLSCLGEEGDRLCTWSLGWAMLQGGISGTRIILNSTWSSSLMFLCCFLFGLDDVEKPPTAQNLGLHCSLVLECQAWACPGPVGGGVSRSVKDCPHSSLPATGEPNAAGGMSSTVMGLHLHQSSQPLRESEINDGSSPMRNQAHGVKRLAQSHSWGAGLRWQWMSSHLGLLSVQEAVARDYSSSHWLGLFPGLDTEFPPFLHTVCKVGQLGNGLQLSLFEGMALTEI